MKKRVFALLLAIVLLSNTMSFAAFRAYLRVVSSEDIQVVRSGERSEYTLTIKNTGLYMAQNLRVEIQGAHPFRSDVSTLYQDVRYIAPNETQTLKFNVMPSPLADTKIYEFDVLFTYKDSEDNVVTNTEKAYVKVENRNQAPSLSVVYHDTNLKETTKDTINSLNIELRNDGDAVANDVRVTLTGLSNTGVILHNESDVKQMRELAGGASERVIYMIKAGPDAKSGTQTLTAVIEWMDDLGTKYKKEQQVYVVIAGSAAGASRLGDVSITEIKAPSALGKEQNFEIRYRVTNTSKSSIPYLELQFEHPEAIIGKTNSRLIIKDLAPGASQDVVVSAMTKKEVQSETYHAYIVATAVNLETDTRTQLAREYVGLFVSGEDTQTSKPKLIIAGYEYGGKAMAGEEFDLNFTIRNTSSSESTRNIKVTLSGDDSVFTPVNSSNSLFIPSIAPGQEAAAKIRYSTKIDAAVKIYTITIKMEYEDGSGKAYDAKNNPYVESETISLNVQQPIRLETSPLQIPEVLFPGEQFYLEQEYYNMGKAPMYNLMIVVDGIQARNPQTFVGNFDAGRSDYLSVQATAGDPGEHTATITYRFEDALGKQSEVVKEFKYTVMDANPEPDPNGGTDGSDGTLPDLPPDYNPDGGSGINWPLIIGGGVVALIVLVLVVRRIRKARAAKMEAMDDES